MPAPSAVPRCTRISGIGPSTSVSRPEDKAADGGESKNSVGRKFYVQHEQDKRAHQKSDRGILQRQQIQGKQGDQHQQCSQRSGNNGAGRIELQIDQQPPEDKQNHSQVGVRQCTQDALSRARRHRLHIGIRVSSTCFAPLKRVTVVPFSWSSKVAALGEIRSIK